MLVYINIMLFHVEKSFRYLYRSIQCLKFPSDYVLTSIFHSFQVMDLHVFREIIFIGHVAKEVTDTVQSKHQWKNNSRNPIEFL